MIQVVELIRGHTFISIKYAAEYYNIPESRLRNVIKKEGFIYKNKKYYFIPFKGKILGNSDTISKKHRYYLRSKSTGFKLFYKKHYIKKNYDRDFKKDFVLYERRKKSK
jgi:hypothetical protein